MFDFTFSYLDTVKAFDGSLRTVGLFILGQSDEPINWFESGADYAAGFAFQAFVKAFKSVAPKGKYPRACRCRIDRDGHVTISLPSGNMAITA